MKQFRSVRLPLIFAVVLALSPGASSAQTPERDFAKAQSIRVREVFMISTDLEKGEAVLKERILNHQKGEAWHIEKVCRADEVEQVISGSLLMPPEAIEKRTPLSRMMWHQGGESLENYVEDIAPSDKAPAWAKDWLLSFYHESLEEVSRLMRFSPKLAMEEAIVATEKEIKKMAENKRERRLALVKNIQEHLLIKVDDQSGTLENMKIRPGTERHAKLHVDGGITTTFSYQLSGDVLTSCVIKSTYKKNTISLLTVEISDTDFPVPEIPPGKRIRVG